MATQEQLKAAILKADAAGDTESAQRFAEMYKSAAPAPKLKPEPRGDDETLVHSGVRAFGNLGPSTVKFVSGLNDMAGELRPSAPWELKRMKRQSDAVEGMIKGVPIVAKQAADIATGGIQRLRERSPEGQRGSAPAMDTTAFDQFAKSLSNKYGTPRRAASTLADDPAPVLANLIPADRLLTGGKAAAEAAKAAKAAKLAASRIEPPAFTRVGRESTALAEDMDRRAATKLATKREAAQAVLDDAVPRLAAKPTQAAKRAAYEETLKSKAAKALAAAESATPAPVGTSGRKLSDINEGVRTSAEANAAKIEAEYQATDKILRDAMEEDARISASEGRGAMDTPEGEELLRKSNEVVNPDKVTRPNVGYEATAETGKKLHQYVLDQLRTKTETLTAEEGQRALKLGQKVTPNPDGSYTKLLKPSLEQIEETRRYVGQVARGEITDYKGINTRKAQELYADLSKAVDSYVDGMHGPVQQNYRAGKAAMQKFEKVASGQKLIGTQKGTDVYKRATSSVMDDMIGGGRDTVEQAIAVAGREPVEAAFRDYVQNLFKESDTVAQLQSKFGPNTKLADAISAMPELERGVADYMANLTTKEQNLAQAAGLGERLTASQARSKNIEKVANELQGKITKSTADLKNAEWVMGELGNAKPEEVGAIYTRVLKEAHATDRINQAQLEEGLKLAKKGEVAFKSKASRDAWLRSVVLAAGGATVGGPFGAMGALSGAAAGLGTGLAVAPVRRFVRGFNKN